MRLDGKTILLVDDDPLVSRLYTKRFVRAGARVVTAFNGVEGLKVAFAAWPILQVHVLWKFCFSPTHRRWRTCVNVCILGLNNHRQFWYFDGDQINVMRNFRIQHGAM